MNTQSIKIKGLSAKEAEFLSILASEGKRVFSFKDAIEASLWKSDTIKQLLSKLTKKKWLVRLEKGKYLIVPFEALLCREFTEHEFIITSTLVTPYYIGFRTALNYYGYTEQVAPVVYVVTTKRKAPVTVGGVKYQFVTFKPERFFGIKSIWMSGMKINISSPEKTIIDSLVFLEYAGGIVEVAKALFFGQEEIKLEEIIECGRKMESGAAMQRLGFLLEFFSLGNEKILKEILSLSSRSYAKLDTVGGDFGKYNSKWKLRINVSSLTLTEWQKY